MNHKINAVIFDQDGLMFDTERMSAKAWEQAGNELGVVIKESILCTIRGMNYDDSTLRFRQEFGAAGVDYEELRRRKREYFLQMLKDQDLPVKPGLYELLSYLKEYGYKISLATASTLEYSLDNLRRTGIRAYFQEIITGDMIKHAKPDPEIFLKAAAVLGEQPEHCLVLEDSLNGVEAGIRGGFQTVMVPDLTQPDDQLRTRVTRVCDSLLEVKEWLDGHG